MENNKCKKNKINERIVDAVISDRNFMIKWVDRMMILLWLVIAFFVLFTAFFIYNKTAEITKLIHAISTLIHGVL